MADFFTRLAARTLNGGAFATSAASRAFHEPDPDLFEETAEADLTPRETPMQTSTRQEPAPLRAPRQEGEMALEKEPVPRSSMPEPRAEERPAPQPDILREPSLEIQEEIPPTLSARLPRATAGDPDTESDEEAPVPPRMDVPSPEPRAQEAGREGRADSATESLPETVHPRFDPLSHLALNDRDADISQSDMKGEGPRQAVPQREPVPGSERNTLSVTRPRDREDPSPDAAAENTETPLRSFVRKLFPRKKDQPSTGLAEEAFGEKGDEAGNGRTAPGISPRPQVPSEERVQGHLAPRLPGFGEEAVPDTAADAEISESDAHGAAAESFPASSVHPRLEPSTLLPDEEDGGEEISRPAARAARQRSAEENLAQPSRRGARSAPVPEPKGSEESPRRNSPAHPDQAARMARRPMPHDTDGEKEQRAERRDEERRADAFLREQERSELPAEARRSRSRTMSARAERAGLEEQAIERVRGEEQRAEEGRVAVKHAEEMVTARARSAENDRRQIEETLRAPQARPREAEQGALRNPSSAGEAALGGNVRGGDPSPPPIRISIGRVEVHAEKPQPPAAPTPPAPRRGPALSLGDYLKQRNRGNQ